MATHVKGDKQRQRERRKPGTRPYQETGNGHPRDAEEIERKGDMEPKIATRNTGASLKDRKGDKELSERQSKTKGDTEPRKLLAWRRREAKGD